MKIPRFLTFFSITCLSAGMFSCSDDSASGENLVLINGMNAAITDVLITSGDEIIINAEVIEKIEKEDIPEAEEIILSAMVLFL